MARNGDGAGDDEPGTWGQFLSGGGLILGVGAVLLFSAIRQTESGPTASLPPRSAERPAPVSVPALPDPPPDAGRIEPIEPVLDPLSRRTLEDPGRLARSAASWTLQLAVVCRKETAHRLLDRAAGIPDLFVLPAIANGQECFRFCWGTFDSREAAIRAGRPAALRGPDFDEPTARRMREVAP